ncbi:Uncharacterized protein APZ42_004539 [Daphnia magna]|uniref:Core-binding (CB) domain-containing protein n=1 Tax=Daphnia magna TaxID=35525 RepID=A0A164GZV5_9CRUS|nr:Uncharacterized protein APZ42_004539 [Daphnia magna]
MAGNQPGTLAAYDSALRNWTNWCLGRGTDLLSATLAEILQYCTDLHASGKFYSTVNLHRSALSKTLGPIEGFAIGEHPLVTRLLKGCYHLNPSRPKYSSIWDTNQVFTYIASLGENKHLALKALGGKFFTLLALATLMRVSELAAINYHSIRFGGGGGVKFALRKLRKAQRCGPLKSFTIASNPTPELCPVFTLENFLEAYESVSV